MARKKEEAVEAIAPDPVLDAMKRWENFAEKNIKQLGGGLAVILLGVLAWQFFGARSERDASVITASLTDAVKAYEEVTEPQKILSSTTAGALDGDLTKAREKFAAIEKAHPGTGASQLASLYEADLARRLRKNDDAEKLYTAYVNAAKKDDVMLFLALEGAGYALEEQGKLDDALKYFQRLTTEPATAFYKDYGFKHTARVLEKKGDKAGAVTAYKSITAMEPASDLKSFAEDKLKQLQ